FGELRVPGVAVSEKTPTRRLCAGPGPLPAARLVPHRWSRPPERFPGGVSGRKDMAATTSVSPVSGGGAARARRGARPRTARGVALGRVREFARLLDRPLASYYLLFGSSILLIVLGLVMVLSSSMVDSYTETGSAFSLFLKQAVAALIGIPLMLLASRLPLRALRLLGGPLLLLSVLLLVLTVFRGVEYYGATR